MSLCSVDAIQCVLKQAPLLVSVEEELAVATLAHGTIVLDKVYQLLGSKHDAARLTHTLGSVAFAHVAPLLLQLGTVERDSHFLSSTAAEKVFRSGGECDGRPEPCPKACDKLVA